MPKLTQVLQGKTQARLLELALDVMTVEFTGDRGNAPVIALWATEGERAVSLTTGGTATKVNLMGEQQVLTPNDGAVVVRARLLTRVCLLMGRSKMLISSVL